jgi:hypothetical protein
MATKKIQITKTRFLEWYFDEDYTTESETIRQDLADRVINALHDNNTCTLTTEDFFNECNKEALRLSYCVGYEDDDEDKYFIELSELDKLDEFWEDGVDDWEIELID